MTFVKCVEVASTYESAGESARRVSSKKSAAPEHTDYRNAIINPILNQCGYGLQSPVCTAGMLYRAQHVPAMTDVRSGVPGQCSVGAWSRSRRPAGERSRAREAGAGPDTCTAPFMPRLCRARDRPESRETRETQPQTADTVQV